MDPRILALGAELTRCRFRETCPGVRKGLVTNEPSLGVVPRGLLVRPHEASAGDIRLVVLGQNPGRWDERHRALGRHALGEGNDRDAYASINRFFASEISPPTGTTSNSTR